MNPKIEKLKAERSRNTEKISDLQNRNRKLSEQITKLENNDIIGMVREIGMTPDSASASDGVSTEVTTSWGLMVRLVKMSALRFSCFSSSSSSSVHSR